MFVNFLKFCTDGFLIKEKRQRGFFMTFVVGRLADKTCEIGGGCHWAFDAGLKREKTVISDPVNYVKAEIGNYGTELNYLVNAAHCLCCCRTSCT